MIWLDPHLYEKGSFYAHTLPTTEGDVQLRGGVGGGYYFWYGSRRRWSWAELATSSLEGLDIFYAHIT